MRGQVARDHEIAVLANGQGGVVSRAQLLRVGLSPKTIDRRVQAGRLHVLHRGVYAVGHRAIGVAGRQWAAVLALGAGAVLSHGNAAAAWEMRSSSSRLIHVTVPGRAGRRRRPGIRVHRPELLPHDEVTRLNGLPITTPARTLLDLAASGLRGRPLESALDQALHRILDFADLQRLLARYPMRPGSPSLEAQLSRYTPGTVDTRSRLEELVLELCDAHGLPRPHVNCVIEGKVRDFHWPGSRLVVEADSYRWHRSPSALNDDRERDVQLTLGGYRSLRFTWEQVTQRREYVVGALLAVLRAS
jgi:Transcriptional regulator, AbiEi antitoxin/Protein of unknown function (DUF559)